MLHAFKTPLGDHANARTETQWARTQSRYTPPRSAWHRCTARTFHAPVVIPQAAIGAGAGAGAPPFVIERPRTGSTAGPQLIFILGWAYAIVCTSALGYQLREMVQLVAKGHRKGYS